MRAASASVTCLACFLQIEVWQALILSSKERLGCTIGPDAAAFKQAYPNLAVKEFPHEGEPCSARAYHADVSLDDGVPRKRARVADQAYYLLTMSAIRTLLRGSIDYAGLFPPAGLDMATAVANYAQYRTGPAAWALGRFIVPVGWLPELEAAAQHLLPQRSEAGPWRLGALAGPDFAEDLAQVSEFNRRQSGLSAVGVTADTVEVKAATESAVEEIMRRIPPDLQAYIEIPIDRDPRGLIAAIRRLGGRAKVRTGGVTTDVFPSTADLIRFVRGCVQEQVPFKATAGLHHPLRAEYRLTYESESPCGTMFGFLNLFLAAAFLLAGMSQADAARLLEEGSPEAIQVDESGITWNGHRLDLESLHRARREGMISFGSCSFTEPIGDLETLHLLEPRARRA
jgi:hypothetical protein